MTYGASCYVTGIFIILIFPPACTHTHIYGNQLTDTTMQDKNV